MNRQQPSTDQVDAAIAATLAPPEEVKILTGQPDVPPRWEQPGFPAPGEADTTPRPPRQ